MTNFLKVLALALCIQNCSSSKARNPNSYKFVANEKSGREYQDWINLKSKEPFKWETYWKGTLDGAWWNKDCVFKVDRHSLAQGRVFDEHSVEFDLALESGNKATKSRSTLHFLFLSFERFVPTAIAKMRFAFDKTGNNLIVSSISKERKVDFSCTFSLENNIRGDVKD